MADDLKRIDPQPIADERTSLEQFLDYQRATLLMKADGLDATAMATRLTTSILTLSGLLKHLAAVEDHWIHVQFLGLPELEPWASAPWSEDDRDWDFTSALDEDPDALRTMYRDACERSRRGVAGVDLDMLSAATDGTGQRWTLRWILTHLIEETARHNGHADMLREAADGSTGE